MQKFDIENIEYIKAKNARLQELAVKSLNKIRGNPFRYLSLSSLEKILETYNELLPEVTVSYIKEAIKEKTLWK